MNCIEDIQLSFMKTAAFSVVPDFKDRIAGRVFHLDFKCSNGDITGLFTMNQLESQLNTLYKEAKTITNDAEKLVCFKALHQFCNEIGTAEDQGIVDYDNMECFFKLITTLFCRLFDLCSPSHKEYQDRLKGKIRAGILKLESLIPNSEDPCPLNIMLTTINAYVKNNNLKGVSQTDEKAMNFRFKHQDEIIDLDLKIDEAGQITSLEIEGKPQVDQILSEAFVPYIKMAYLEVLKKSSVYDPWASELKISLVPEGTSLIPDFHLFSVCSSIIDGYPRLQKLKVDHLGDNLEPSPGNDGGGLARNYVDSLAEAILRSQKIQVIRPCLQGVDFPGTKANYDGNKLPQLTEEEINIYSGLGTLMMFCYSQDQLLVGHRFHPSIIHAALSLSSDEVEEDYLSLTSQKNILLCILEAIRAENPKIEEFDKTFRDLIDALKFYDYDPQAGVQLSDKELTLLFNLMGGSSLQNVKNESDKYWGEGDPNFKCDYTQPHLELIRRDLPKFLTLARSAMVTQKFDFMPELVQCLGPVHQMAKGMKKICSEWGNIDKNAFNLKVQGSLDPEQIIAAFSYVYDPVVGQKVDWLKEWLRKEATPLELGNFLKFVTGSSTMVPNMGIKVYDMYSFDRAHPVAHTCSNSIEISNRFHSDSTHPRDDSKKEFILRVNEVMRQKGFDIN